MATEPCPFNDKILSGYTGSCVKVRRKLYLKELKHLSENGFNCIDIKLTAWDIDDKGALDYINQMANDVSKKGLKLFVYLNPRKKNRLETDNDLLPSYVDTTGKIHTNTFCPYHYEVWDKRYFGDYLKAIAKLSLKAPIEGAKFDIEPIQSRGFCYCDSCWMRFVQSHNLPPESKSIPKDKRYGWLEKQGLSKEYAQHQEKTLDGIVSSLRKEAHSINPKLKLGIMPVLNSNFHRPFLKNLATDDVPAIVDDWIMYEMGFGDEVLKRRDWIKSLNPNNIYIPWLRINIYRSKEIGSNAYYAAMACDGYNLWCLAMIIDDPSLNKGLDTRLIAGEKMDNYWSGLGQANQEIKSRMQIGDSYKTKLKLKFTPVIPGIDISGWKPKNLKPLNSDADIKYGQTSTLRGDHIFSAFAESGETLEFTITHNAGKARSTAIRHILLDPQGNMLQDGTTWPGEKTHTVKKAPLTGTYTLFVSTVPGAGPWYTVKFLSRYYVLEASQDSSVRIFSQAGRMYFYVPEGTDEFYLDISTGRTGTAELMVYSPEGKVIGQVISTGGNFDVYSKALKVKVPPGKSGKVWSLTVGPPKKEISNEHYFWQDVKFRLRGLPPYLTDDPSRLLVPENKMTGK